MIRVRFAPSPTGFLHIGGARTALFNWMYAKAQGGQFILRIEDTDRVRSKNEYLDEILDSMTWLGITWDEFYKQSDRFALYRQYADKLLTEGRAYKDKEAVILKVPSLQSIKIYDIVRGEIVVDTREIKDQVLMKSDGSPTYSFACVIDDALMEISCVIRGEDHISNTPKQLLIYEALAFKPPKFAHLPLILDPEGGRMSKRAGAVAVTEYRKQGFLPQAIVNYLMLLGWSPGNNQEKISMASALKAFSIKKINKAGAAFSLDKLKWINGQYIKEADTPHLADALMPLVRAQYPHLPLPSRQEFERIVSLFKNRMSTLLDFLEWTDFIFNDAVSIPEDLRNEHLPVVMRQNFELLAQALSRITDFNAKTSEEAFRSLVAELGIEAGKLVHPVRVALTGRTVGPGLFDTMDLLGRDRVIRRLRETFP